jgi:Ser/Thr protein kinase RdoA (MazF antagonist)
LSAELRGKLDAEDAYAKEAKVQRCIDDDIRQVLWQHWGIEIQSFSPLFGGEASSIWKIDTQDQPLVVRIAPEHMCPSHLEYRLRVQAGVSTALDIVPMPCETTSGSLVVLSGSNPISVQAVCSGRIREYLTHENRIEAARALAVVHLALDSCEVPAVQLQPHLESTHSNPCPDELRDDDLDAWIVSLPSSGWHRGLIHGDYYNRNVLWNEDRISGVIDWDELTLDWREQEIAWSMWEFCQIDDGTRLDVPSSCDFLDAYRSRNANIAPSLPSQAFRFIQRRLRTKCLNALHDRAVGRPFDEEYFLSEVEAFGNIRGLVISG